MVYDFRTGTTSRVPIHFASATDASVDTAGTVIAFNPVGGGFDYFVVSLADSAGIETLANLGFDRRDPVISPDGRYLSTLRAVGSGREVFVYDRILRSDRMVGSLPDYSALGVVHWFAGGDSLLLHGSTVGFGGLDYRVFRLSDGSSGPFSFAPALNAETLALSRDERWLALGRPVPAGQSRDSADVRTIHIYDLHRGVRTTAVELPHDVWHLAWSPDGSFLAHTPSPFTTREAILEVINRLTGKRTVLIPSRIDDAGAFRPIWINQESCDDVSKCS